MDAYKRCGIEGIHSGVHVHWVEEATQYEDILGKKKFFFPFLFSC